MNTRLAIFLALPLILPSTYVDAGPPSAPTNKTSPAKLPAPPGKPPQSTYSTTPKGQYFDEPPAPNGSASGYQKMPAAPQYQNPTVAPAQRGEGQTLKRTDAMRQLPSRPKTGGAPPTDRHYDVPEGGPEQSASGYQKMPTAPQYQNPTVAPAQRGEGQTLKRTDAMRQLPSRPKTNGAPPTDRHYDVPEGGPDQSASGYQKMPAAPAYESR